jgi:hypothetical protein
MTLTCRCANSMHCPFKASASTSLLLSVVEKCNVMESLEHSPSNQGMKIAGGTPSFGKRSSENPGTDLDSPELLDSSGNEQIRPSAKTLVRSQRDSKGSPLPVFYLKGSPPSVSPESPSACPSCDRRFLRATKLTHR